MLKYEGCVHCVGTAFCEIRSFLRSSIRVSFLESDVFGVLDVGLRFRVLRRSSVFVTSLS